MSSPGRYPPPKLTRLCQLSASLTALLPADQQARERDGLSPARRIRRLTRGRCRRLYMPLCRSLMVILVAPLTSTGA